MGRCGPVHGTPVFPLGIHLDLGSSSPEWRRQQHLEGNNTLGGATGHSQRHVCGTQVWNVCTCAQTRAYGSEGAAGLQGWGGIRPDYRKQLRHRHSALLDQCPRGVDDF